MKGSLTCNPQRGARRERGELSLERANCAPRMRPGRSPARCAAPLLPAPAAALHKGLLCSLGSVLNI